MSSTNPRQKVVVLGGGIAALTAAYELTDPPDWKDRYEVTVYQMGWRLGGKCASGRNPDVHQRIEEHGLHVWGGFYENAFALMRRCYAELNRPPGSPLATWDQAFKPQNFVVFEEQVNGNWVHWPRMLAVNYSLPGEGEELLPLWEYMSMALQWMVSAFTSSPYYRPREETPGHEPPGWLSRFFADSEAIVVSIATGVVEGLGFLGRCSAHLLLDTAESLLGFLGEEPAGAESPDAGILWLLDEFADRLRNQLADRIEEDTAARRLWVLTDFFHAVIRGVLVDGVIWKGFQQIDEYDFREWLAHHGATELTLNAAPLHAFYDYFFAFENGDVTRPRLAAGVALNHLMRLTLTYKTAIFWEMQAGMGDVVFAPLFEVLKRRGVVFKFFHRVEKLQLSADNTSVAAIRVARQVTLKQGEYDPLVTVKGLRCWPSQPRYEQIVEGEQLRGVDLESAWSGWQDAETMRLEAGRDFDQIILGITLEPLRTLCSELADANATWREMFAHLKTVQTLGVQLWLDADAVALGWDLPAPLMTGYAQPLNTWGDFSHLVAQENWPGGKAPRSLAYFCGPFPDAAVIPGTEDLGFPAREAAHLQATSVRWMEEHLPHLLPGLRNGEGFRWDQVTDPQQRQGAARFQAQFWRANISPADRYVLSLPGDSKYRLTRGQSGFANLFVVGDWVYTGLGGCVEGAVMSGMMGCRALAGYPRRIIGEMEADATPVPSVRGIRGTPVLGTISP